MNGEGVEHKKKLDIGLERLRENQMEPGTEIEGKERALNITDKIIGKAEVGC